MSREADKFAAELAVTACVRDEPYEPLSWADHARWMYAEAEKQARERVMSQIRREKQDEHEGT